MNLRTKMGGRGHKSKNTQGEGPNWVFIAGGALLSTISIHLAYKLKQALDAKQPDNATMKVSGKSADKSRVGSCLQHSNMYCFGPEVYSCFSCATEAEGMADIKNPPNGQNLAEPDTTLPLVAVSVHEYNRENGMAWASSPEHLEPSPKPLHHSNCSQSPCASESGSDVFSKREVIQKLRLQLRRRDDMILEMQDQIVELQNTLSAQMSHSNNLQLQLDTITRELFESEREIQRLREAIANHCVGHSELNDKRLVSSEGKSGLVNGSLLDGESSVGISDKDRADREIIEMLKREIQELKEVIQGKEYLVQSYKEQKTELSVKIKELQQRLDSQLPNIL
ncbi:hypothetical protein Ancab_035492 [Ancistrocladus abbreviatus]